MKNLTKGLCYSLYLLLVCIYSGQAQDFSSIGYQDDCGNWVEDSIYYTDWVNTDTINYNPNADSTWI